MHLLTPSGIAAELRSAEPSQMHWLDVNWVPEECLQGEGAGMDADGHGVGMHVLTPICIAAEFRSTWLEVLPKISLKLDIRLRRD